jgi:hypothetical protein
VSRKMSLQQIEGKHVRCIVEQPSLSQIVSGIERHPRWGRSVCVPASAVVSGWAGEGVTGLANHASRPVRNQILTGVTVGPNTRRNTTVVHPTLRYHRSPCACQPRTSCLGLWLATARQSPIGEWPTPPGYDGHTPTLFAVQYTSMVHLALRYHDHRVRASLGRFVLGLWLATARQSPGRECPTPPGYDGHTLTLFAAQYTTSIAIRTQSGPQFSTEGRTPRSEKT